jgi:hypothetical protein
MSYDKRNEERKATEELKLRANFRFLLELYRKHQLSIKFQLAVAGQNMRIFLFYDRSSDIGATQADIMGD